MRFDIERLNEIEIYDAKEPVVDQGFRTIHVLENAHPLGGIWWPRGPIASGGNTLSFTPFRSF